MSTRFEFGVEVRNYAGGEPLFLEVGANDGAVFIGVSPAADPGRGWKCSIEPDVARQVVAAMNTALSHLVALEAAAKTRAETKS